LRSAAPADDLTEAVAHEAVRQDAGVHRAA
jgi:hypothetical protein